MSAWVRCERGSRFRRRGLSVIYIVLIVILLAGIVSLAVDMGRVRLARSELQTAADAAARAGAQSLPVSSQDAIDRADEAALDNKVIDVDETTAGHIGQRINTGVSLQDDEDVTFGVWNPNTLTFTPITDNNGTTRDDRRRANAVRVIARRTEARGNALPLIFGPVVGAFKSSLQRPATAYVTGGPHNFAFIGIQGIASNGNKATVDSMVFGHNGQGGGVASDATIDLGNGDVYGDARPGKIGLGQLLLGPNATVTGWTANLDYSLAPLYPPATVPGNATAVTLPGNNKPWTLPPAGITPSNNPNAPVKLKLNANLSKIKSLTVTGYVELYVTGNVDLKGNSVVNTGNPANPSKFTLYVIGANTTVDVGGTPTQYMHLYAPQSAVTFTGTSDFFGWIVGKSITFKGTTNLHYDESLKGTTPYKILLVE